MTAPPAPTAPLPHQEEWQRLHPRMLLVHPVRELVRFLPALVGVVVAGAATGQMDPRWQVPAVAVPVLLGLARYLTTSYRITGERVELRRGLLERHALSTRLERVRTVDLTASPIHRVLGLATVRIGTGTASTQDEDQLDLDGLAVEDARRLRTVLLGRTDLEPGSTTEPAPAGHVVVRLDLGWVRFAPLTSSGVVLGAAIVGAGAQVLEVLGTGIELDLDSATLSWRWFPAVLVGLLAAVSLLAVGGYLVTNWGFTLTRERGSWHLSRGLLTTRETTLDEERVAGLVIGEPLGLRLARGGRLSAIVTGLRRDERGSSALVPPAPVTVVDTVASDVLGSSAPVLGSLVGHGARATTRRYTRALVPAALLAAALGAALSVGDPASWWLLATAVPLAAGVALARDRARSLGHSLTDGYVVSRQGSLYRRRDALAASHVIGWTFRSTWFQRRAGLVSLVATTAGGRQAVTLLDVPEDVGLALADRAVPGLVSQFVTAT